MIEVSLTPVNKNTFNKDKIKKLSQIIRTTLGTYTRLTEKMAVW